MLLDPDGPTYQSSTAEAQRERKKKGRSKSKASIYFITLVTAPENIIEPIEILSKMFSKKKKIQNTPTPKQKNKQKKPPNKPSKKKPTKPQNLDNQLIYTEIHASGYAKLHLWRLPVISIPFI